MSENIYRCEFTASELFDVLDSMKSAANGAAHAAVVFPGKRAESYRADSARYQAIYDKLRALARRCDVQPSYLSDLERGNRTSVGVTVAVRLAEVLDCTAVELDAPVRISTTTASKAFAIWAETNGTTEGNG